MRLSLADKTAIVCGSTQGIGFASAVELANLGANCVLFARNEAALIEAVDQLDTTFNQQHQYLVADFDNPSAVQFAIEKFVQTNPVHILVNNTGGPNAGQIEYATTDEFMLAFNRHLICNHIITQAVIPSMKDAAYGRIINIISTSVKIPLANLGVSNTIRGAVASWSKTMANELGQFHITVNNVLPGYTKTARLQSLIEKNAAKRNVSVNALTHEMEQDIPLKRFATPDEVGNVVAFLSTPAAAYINGVNIPVDGGRTGSM